MIAHVHVIIQPGEAGSAVVDIFRIQDGMVAEHWDVAQQIPHHAQNRNGTYATYTALPISVPPAQYPAAFCPSGHLSNR
jgi:hypothetical protein